MVGALGRRPCRTSISGGAGARLAKVRRHLRQQCRQGGAGGTAPKGLAAPRLSRAVMPLAARWTIAARCRGLLGLRLEGVDEPSKARAPEQPPDQPGSLHMQHSAHSDRSGRLTPNAEAIDEYRLTDDDGAVQDYLARYGCGDARLSPLDQPRRGGWLGHDHVAPRRTMASTSRRKPCRWHGLRLSDSDNSFAASKAWWRVVRGYLIRRRSCRASSTATRSALRIG